MNNTSLGVSPVAEVRESVKQPREFGVAPFFPSGACDESLRSGGEEMCDVFYLGFFLGSGGERGVREKSRSFVYGRHAPIIISYYPARNFKPSEQSIASFGLSHCLVFSSSLISTPHPPASEQNGDAESPPCSAGEAIGSRR